MIVRTCTGAVFGTLMISLLVATSEAPTPDPAPNSATPAPVETVSDVPAEVPSWEGHVCPEGLLHHYAALVNNGCALKTSNDDLAMTYRALRNVAYAAQGRRFKSPELTALFTQSMCSGTNASAYAPTDKEVQITQPDEKTCISALRAREKELRASGTQPPKAVEAHILSKFGAHIVSDAKRLSGGEVWGSMPSVSKGEDGSWTVTFYQEYMDGTDEDPVKIESATIIQCTSDGSSCEEMVAG